MQEKLGDTDIIQLVLNGQKQAYAILVERYQSYVFSLALRYISERELAEELAQDVFIKAYRSLKDFKGNSKFSTWLYTIVHTTCLSSLRKRKSSIVLVDDISTIGSAQYEQSGIDEKWTKHLLNEAINRLEPSDAEVIFLFYQAEQSLDEIAVITGQTAGNIKVRLFRARQKLKQVITRYYPHEFSDR